VALVLVVQAFNQPVEATGGAVDNDR
jgi:hypothetical protein